MELEFLTWLESKRRQRKQKDIEEKIMLMNKQNEKDNTSLTIIESCLSLEACDHEALHALLSIKDGIKERMAKREARIR